MNNTDKLLKDAKILIDSAKDLASKNLLNAVSTGVVKVDASQLPKLIAIVELSIDEGYLRAGLAFQAAAKKVISGT